MTGAFFATVAVCASRCAIAEDIETIVRAWGELRAASPCVSYAMEGVSFTAQGALGREEGIIPPEDTTNPVRIEWVIDFEHERFRRYESFPTYDITQKGYLPRESTFVFADGKGVELLPDVRDKSAPESALPNVEFIENSQVATLPEWDYFVLLAHGYAPLRPSMERFSGKEVKEFATPRDASNLSLVGEAVHEDYPEGVLLLRTPAVEGFAQSYDEYGVAPSVGYRVVHVLRYELGKVGREITIRYDRDANGDVYMSDAQATSLRGPGSTVTEDLSLRTVSFSSDALKQDAFRLTPKVGMLVMDGANPFHQYEYTGVPNSRRTAWVVMLLVVTLIGSMVIVLFRRARARRSR